jgi:peptidoglycan L-alanyl-D-glutamate endopeptidase CwlK
MPVNRKVIFDAVKALRNGQGYTLPEVKMLDAAIDVATGEHLVTVNVPPAPAPSKFKLSQLSLNNLAHVKPQIVDCVKLAITKTLTDFRVQQGERTLAEQKAAVAAGNSRTMHSKHLRQADGFVWAVDLVCIVDGKVSWEFNRYAAIALAMDQAATQLGIASHIRWGCAWDRVLADFGGDVHSYLDEAKAYAARHPGSDLLDAPHFEWVP